jgi:hypothetical protein
MSELIKTLDEIWRFYESDKQGIIAFFTSSYKHFNKKAKRKEAEAMEERLNSKRESVKRIKQFLISNDWLPTPENINALPEPIRKFIHDIETNTDPAHIVRENILIKDTCKLLVIKLEEKQTVTNKWIEEKAVDTANDYPDVAFPNLIAIFKKLLKEAGVKVLKK